MFEKDKDAIAFGVTALDNAFIMDYLPAAKGDYIKVYLYGLFCCQAMNEPYSLEDMAQDLSMDVPQIEAAFRYWERRALVSRLSDNPPRFRFHSPLQKKASPGPALAVDSDYVSFAESVYAIFADRRKITPAEIALAWEWVQDVGLPPEVVLMLIIHCTSQRGLHFSFKKAEPLAIRMKEEKVLTPDDAELFLQHDQQVHDGARKVLSRMGKRRFASDDELALYEKWLGEWQFSPEAILDACAETTKGDPSFKYLDGILSGIRTRGEARTADAVRKQLSEEKDERARAQEVFSHLGVSLAAPAAIRLYRQCIEIQPHEVLLLAAKECSRSRKGSIEDLQLLLEAWKKRGLQDAASVRAYLTRYREANLALKEMFDACGHNGRPAESDRLLYEKWRGWGMSRELLLFAAEQSRVAEGSKIAYLSKVLDMWHEAGITEISQASPKANQQKPAPQPAGKTVSAQRYGQRDYTEAELLSVSEDLLEEARKHRG